MKKSLVFLIFALVCVLAAPFVLAEGGVYLAGDQMYDFTVTTYDGREITLSQVLAEKELVIINIWASWCNPCMMEFPYMQQAYEMYQDKVEIIALSCEPTDSGDVIRGVAEAKGLTFPMGQDTAGVAEAFYVSSIPTTIVIDRFGTVCLVEIGAQDSADNFARLFDVFLGDGYTESVILTGIPAERPDAPAFSEEELSLALNGDGGSILFRNPEDIYNWNMAVADVDGRSVVMSTNQGMPESSSSVIAEVEASAGDVLAFEFRVSGDYCCDVMKLYVDGELVKRVGSDRGWCAYAYEFETDGAHEIEIAYTKDVSVDDGEDTLFIDNVRILTGDEAAAALAANPAYPAHEATDIRVLNGEKVTVEDPYGVLTGYFGVMPECYIVNGEEAELEFTLEAGVDPDAAVMFDSCEYNIFCLADLAEGDVYRTTCKLNSLDFNDECWTAVFFYPDVDGVDIVPAVLFADEENAWYFVNNYLGGSWEYAAAAAENYQVKVMDGDGNPVPGAVLQVCDESSCMVYVTDDNGCAEFEAAPAVYEVHVLEAPEGYGAAEDVYYTEDVPSQLVITLGKE